MKLSNSILKTLKINTENILALNYPIKFNCSQLQFTVGPVAAEIAMIPVINQYVLFFTI